MQWVSLKIRGDRAYVDVIDEGRDENRPVTRKDGEWKSREDVLYVLASWGIGHRLVIGCLFIGWAITRSCIT